MTCRTCDCADKAADTDEWVTFAKRPVEPLQWSGVCIVRVFTEDKPTDVDTEDAVYLSGPMTGLPDFNRPAFHAAAAALREQGHVVINPAEVDLGPDATWADYMRIHLAEIARRVTQVFVLPGWESSRGAQLEVHVARSLGLPVVPAPAPEDPDASDRQCAWADYRKDYGVGEPEMVAAHKAFMAGWKAAREGDQSGPLR